MQESAFETLGLMIDCSRNAVMKPEAVRFLIDRMEQMGYNTLMLYTEDTYEVENQPYFGHLRGRYSADELRALDDYAAAHHVTLIPCVQTLAHLNALMRWPQYSEIRDCADILCVGEEKVYDLIRDLFSTLSKCFRSKLIHVGMDEAGMLGRGRYFDRNGAQPRMEILLAHLRRVAQIADEFGFSLLMWHDMFFKIADEGKVDFEALQIPRNIRLVYWNYYCGSQGPYDGGIEKSQQIQPDVWFAGGIWTWTGFAPHLTHSLNVSEPAVRSCLEHGVKHVIFTLWGDNGGECSRFSVLPGMYAAAEFARGNFDRAQIKAGFRDLFGVDWDDFALLELPETRNTAMRVNNPDKYMLYNDCLLGCMDGKAYPGDAAAYARCAARLRAVRVAAPYAVLFESMAALCDVLAVKYDIGVRTREAYRTSKDALRALLPDYDELLARLQVFYDAYERQWMAENKPHGFDVQDLRLGGLMQRVRHAKRVLERYLADETDRIEELEAPVLEVNGRVEEPEIEPFSYNAWSSTATSNCI